ncbi:hypothetical protein GC56T3_2616 [Geobacillus sp. C56-T3]|nr:hypothetical protein GC56T3_2616 [Geobacillus sp. C56-T3]ADU93333.1 hypothetical protein GYMC52_0857 [Geobacillus sp. Y412MC52]
MKGNMGQWGVFNFPLSCRMKASGSDDDRREMYRLWRRVNYSRFALLEVGVFFRNYDKTHLNEA